MNRPSIPMVVYQHATDAAFFWALRERGLDAPDFDLDELAHLEAKLEANLSALRLHGDTGWTHALDELKRWRAPGEAFVCMWLALASSDLERIAATLLQVEDEPEAFRGVASALAWCEWETIADWVSAWTDEADSDLRYLASCAAASHGMWAGVDTAFRDPDPRIRWAACRYAGQAGVIQAVPALESALQDAEPGVRLEAACALAFLGSDNGLPLLIEQAKTGLCPPMLATVLGQRMSDEALDDLINIGAGLPKGNRINLVQYSGAVRWIDQLILTDDLDLTRVVDAVAHITGIPVPEKVLGIAELSPDEAAEPGAMTEAKEDFCAWWSAQRGQFSSSRYIAGKAVSAEQAGELVHHANQSVRKHAAWISGLRATGSKVFDVRNRVKRQRADLRRMTQSS